jgi:hypothetical protein
MIELKRYAGAEIVVQLKDGQKWFLWTSPPKSKKSPFPELAQGRGPEGEMVPVPLPFLQGKVTDDGKLLVNTGSGGTLSVEIALETIASVTQIATHADEAVGVSSIIIPGN